jgi:hypothetical protein
MCPRSCRKTTVFFAAHINRDLSGVAHSWSSSKWEAPAGGCRDLNGLGIGGNEFGFPGGVAGHRVAVPFGEYVRFDLFFDTDASAGTLFIAGQATNIVDFPFEIQCDGVMTLRSIDGSGSGTSQWHPEIPRGSQAIDSAAPTAVAIIHNH